MAAIEKRGENSYRLTVSCGYDSKGKKIFKKKTINLPANMTEKQREKELQKQFNLFQEAVEKGTYLDGSKITFGEFINKWLVDYAEKELAPSTLHVYKTRIEKRIIPALGHIKLDRLQPTHLLEFYNNLGESGICLDELYVISGDYSGKIKNIGEISSSSGINQKTLKKIKKLFPTNKETANKLSNYFGIPLHKLFSIHESDKKLSSRTIAHHHRLISALLTAAVQWQLIESNPAKRLKPPKVEKSHAKFYDNEDVVKMFECLENEPLQYKVMIYITIYGGLRLSEMVALEWSDISGNILSINKARQYISGKGCFEKSTKTNSSNREITLPNNVISLLEEYHTWQNEEQNKLGDLWKGSNKLFTQTDGTPIFPSRPTVWFRTFLKRHNLPPITFHQLRHTNASLLVSLGVDITTVSKRLGHSRTSTTLDIYAHSIKSRDEEAATKLENLLLVDKNNTDNNDENSSV